MISLLLAASFLLNLGLAWIIFSKNRKSKVNFSFATFAFCFSLFALFFGLYYTPIILTSLFWIKVVYIMVSLLIISFYYFAEVFPYNEKPNAKILAFYILINIPFVIVLFTTPYYVEKVYQSQYGLETITGWFYVVVCVFLIPMVLYPVLILLRKFRKSRGLVREQLIYILIGAASWALSGVIFDGIIPIFLRTSTFFSLSSVSSLVFVILASYAIIKHRLFDIRFVVLKGLLYSFFIAFLGIFYSSVLAVLAALFLGGQVTIARLTFATVVAFSTIISFYVFQSIFKKISETIFYRDRYNPQALVAKVGKIVASSIELSHISEEIIKEFLSQMKLSAGSLAVSREGTVSRVKQIGEMENPSTHGQKLYQIIENIVKSPGENVLVRDEISESEEKTLMEKGKYNVILPLVAGSETVGAIILGNKISGQVYSTEDIKILKILAPQIAMAIKNALSYEQTKEFSILLQIRVERATEHLKQANERLKDLDKLKDEFVSITSHELRTPMTVIKGYVWRILNDKKEGPLSEKTKERLQLIYDSTEREIALVNDILDISRIEAGTMIFNPTIFDIGKLAQDVKDELSENFTKKKLELIVQKVKYNVKADQNNIHQVLTNLLVNSLKFTESGKVEVSFTKKGKFIQTSISDTGIGIKKSDFPRLFTKFGKLGSTLSPLSSSAGTGLGLYLCKKFVERSKGKIWVESEFGKGSRFTFSLPKST